MEIDPADVIRLVQQYLKENSLIKTLQCLQDESQVNLNTVDSIEAFVSDINSGNWDVVLRVVKLLKLPDNKLIDLYEQIAIELIELRETRAANWLIHKTEPMIKLRSSAPERYLHLQNLLAKPFFDHKEAYRDGSCKERRRGIIADSLAKEVTVVPSQRLLGLIGDALKWQKHEGLLPSSTSIDIFTGRAHMVHAEEEAPVAHLHKHCIKPVTNTDDDDDAPKIFVCCAEFSPDGHYLLVGWSNGLVEARHSTTGRLAKDLKYQAQNACIVTPSRSAALSLAFSGGDIVAVGDRSGDISLWKLSTGQLVQLFQKAHAEKGVTCMIFHRNGKEILSGSLDSTVKLHGIRSNRTIRDFRAHKSFVNAAAFSRDDNFVISGGKDSTVKFWNARTAQLLYEFKALGPVHSVQVMTNYNNDIFLVGSKRGLQLIDIEGKVKHKILADEPPEKKNGDGHQDDKSMAVVAESPEVFFYSSCASPKGNYLYAVGGNQIYCYNHSDKKLHSKVLAHDGTAYDLIGVKHHPFVNLVATFDNQGNLKLWKP